MGATALLAAIGNGRQFQKVRDLAAWLGLVPREFSTGGKQKLFGISKRGNRYVRKLLVHGARSCFRHLDRTRDRLGNWLDGFQARRHPAASGFRSERCQTSNWNACRLRVGIPVRLHRNTQTSYANAVLRSNGGSRQDT
uniref:transposase n=1 Tax=Shinella sp. PSBB067 TaxID=2715959 RepID=UPI00351C6895